MKKTAKTLVDNGSVRILVDSTIPPAAIAVLGKGLGFVPTPKPNQVELRLDARRLVNKLLYKNPAPNECPSEETSVDAGLMLIIIYMYNNQYSRVTVAVTEVCN